LFVFDCEEDEVVVYLSPVVLENSRGLMDELYREPLQFLLSRQKTI
jgi:hypothetical protein